MKIIKVATVLLALGSPYVFADVDCSTDNCVFLQGTVEQVGLDVGGMMHAYSSAFPVATPTDPYIFVKLSGTGIGTGLSLCGVGDDAAVGLLNYNNLMNGSIVVDARKSIYATLMTAKSSAQTVLMVVDDSATCEIAGAILTVP